MAGAGPRLAHGPTSPSAPGFSRVVTAGRPGGAARAAAAATDSLRPAGLVAMAACLCARSAVTVLRVRGNGSGRPGARPRGGRPGAPGNGGWARSAAGPVPRLRLVALVSYTRDSELHVLVVRVLRSRITPGIVECATTQSLGRRGGAAARARCIQFGPNVEFRANPFNCGLCFRGWINNCIYLQSRLISIS